MFSLLRIAIYITGSIVVASFAAGYVGYTVDTTMLTGALTNPTCHEKILSCRTGGNMLDNARCIASCVEWQRVVRKTAQPPSPPSSTTAE